jgi:hypothetical protein
MDAVFTHTTGFGFTVPSVNEIQLVFGVLGLLAAPFIGFLRIA